MWILVSHPRGGLNILECLTIQNIYIEQGAGDRAKKTAYWALSLQDM